MASKLEEEISCPVCKEIYKDPVILPCTHSFCYTCFKKSKSSRECPVCKKGTLKTDPILNLALKNLCEIYSLKRSQIGALCSLHKRKLELFCHEDEQLVCLVCRDSKQHKNHNFSPIVEAAVDRKVKIKTSLEPLKAKLKDLEENKLIYNEMVKKNKHKEKQIKEESEKLQDEEATRIAAREEEEQKSQMMKEKMSREISSLSDTIRAIEEKMGADDVTFLQSYKSTVERAQCTLQDPERDSGAPHNVKSKGWWKLKNIILNSDINKLDGNSKEDAIKVKYKSGSSTTSAAAVGHTRDQEFESSAQLQDSRYKSGSSTTSAAAVGHTRDQEFESSAQLQDSRIDYEEMMKENRSLKEKLDTSQNEHDKLKIKYDELFSRVSVEVTRELLSNKRTFESLSDPFNESTLNKMYKKLQNVHWSDLKVNERQTIEESGLHILHTWKRIFEKARCDIQELNNSFKKVLPADEQRENKKDLEFIASATHGLQKVFSDTSDTYYQNVVRGLGVEEFLVKLAAQYYKLMCMMLLHNPPMQPDWEQAEGEHLSDEEKMFPPITMM